MDSTILWIIAIVILISTAYFSLAETALMSVSRLAVKTMQETLGSTKRILALKKLLNSREKLVSTILIMSNITAIIFSTIATALSLIYLDGEGLAFAMFVSAAASTVGIIVLGDILPKVIAAKFPEKVAVRVARPISFFFKVFSPITFVINISVEGLLRIFGVKKAEKVGTITEDEIKTALSTGYEEGLIAEEQSDMIDNVLELKGVYAKDIMTPRTELIAIDASENFETVVGIFRSEKYTRVPVFENSIDNIIGVLHLKDIIFDGNDDDFVKNFSPKRLALKPIFTYEMQPIERIFANMRTEGTNLAIVADEYGGTAGIVSMEDIVEAVMGDIFDEHDERKKDIIQILEGIEYIVAGQLRIIDFNFELQEYLPTRLISENQDTLGGYVIGLFGHIPSKGETIEDGLVRYSVEDADKSRIVSLRIYILAKEQKTDQVLLADSLNQENNQSGTHKQEEKNG